MKKIRFETVVIILILLIGTTLRFTNVNWDSYQAFHPDERNIAWAVTRIHWFDELNPKFFAYGGLPIYLYKILSDITARSTGDPTWTTDWGKIAVVGRYVSATLSSLSLPLIYLVGLRFFSPAVGVLAMFFLAFSPWAIREAHFATTETMLVFFLLSLLLASLQWSMKPNKRTVILLGIIWGLAVGAKTTSLLFGVIPLTAFIAKKRFPDVIRFLLIAICIFLLVSMYTVIDWTGFRESMKYETGVALGKFSVPYTLQFNGTIPYLFQLQTMIWQAGPVAILGLAGMLILAVFRRRAPLLFLIFPTLYFLWSGSWYAKFARYTVPFLPFATLAAAWITISFWHFIGRIGRIGKLVGLFFMVGLVGFHALWGIMNWSIYLHPDTRIQASQWISSHVPTRAKLLTEHWNDGLPVPNPRELLTVYDEDSDRKMATLEAELASADYLILTTRRIWGTMPRLTDRYPKTSVWYQKLLNGQREYKEVATFSRYPSFFGIVMNDDTAEESIQVFDHPTVRIFQNTREVSKEEAEEKIKGN